MTGLVVGVELGADRVRAATSSDGAPQLTVDMPAVVAVTSDGAVATGDAAEAVASSDPKRAVGGVRDELGRAEPFVVGGVPYGTESILAELLRAAVDAAGAGDGTRIAATFPVAFAPHQLDLLREVARLAAVGDVAFVDEDTARSYGPQEGAGDLAIGAALWLDRVSDPGPTAGAPRSSRRVLIGAAAGAVVGAAGVAGLAASAAGAGVVDTGKTLGDFADGGKTLGDFADSGKTLGDFADSGKTLGDFAAAPGAPPGAAAEPAGLSAPRVSRPRPRIPRVPAAVAAVAVAGAAAVGAVAVSRGGGDDTALSTSATTDVTAAAPPEGEGAPSTTSTALSTSTSLPVRDIEFLFAGGVEGSVGGGDGGAATAASMVHPFDVALAPDGRVLILEQGNHSKGGRLRIVDTEGVISTAPTTVEGKNLLYPRALDVAADGTVYIADAGNHRVLRVATDGTVTRFAGTGEAPVGDPGHQVPATSVTLGTVEDLAVAPDGSLLIVDESRDVIQRIDGQGVITVIAGNGKEALEDGVSATAARLNAGDGGPLALAVAADGTIYFGTWKSIWKLQDGVLTRVAGDLRQAAEDEEANGDGGPARDAPVSVSDLAVGPDGTLFVSENDARSIRTIRQDGIIRRFAGGSSTSPGVPPTNRHLTPQGIAVAADGRVYVAEPGTTYNMVRLLPAQGLPWSPP